MVLFASGCKDPILGCLDNTAVNYSDAVTEDDGTCVYTIIKKWDILDMYVNGVEISSPGESIEFFSDYTYSVITAAGLETGNYLFSNYVLTMEALSSGPSISYTGMWNITVFNGSQLTISGYFGNNSVEIIMGS